MNYTLECELEDNGRWLAEALQLPGVLAYGFTRDEAMAKAEALALQVIAELPGQSPEAGPRMLARMVRHTGPAPHDL